MGPWGGMPGSWKRATILAIGLGLILILFPLYRLDPNRVVRGTVVFFLDLVGSWGLAAVGFLTWGAVLVLAFGFAAPAVVAVWGLLGLWGLPGLVGQQLVPMGMRLSPELGFWALHIWLLLPLLLDERRRRWPLHLALWGFVLGVLAFQSGSPLSIFVELRSQQNRLLAELVQHLLLSGTSLAVALLLALPLGVAAARTIWGGWVYSLSGLIQTVPTLALLGLLMVPLSGLARLFPTLRAWGLSGIGSAPAVAALAIYALLPLMSGIREGLRAVPPQVREAARGLGLSEWQLFWKVEVPLSLPLVLAGLRTAVVQNLGNAALAPLIGAGGLGYFIFQGIGQTSADMVLLGVLPLLMLTLGADVLLRLLEGAQNERRGHVRAGL